LGIKAVNQLAKKYNVQTIKRFLDLFCGDYVLVADSIDFLNLKPTPNFPVENYVGFIRPSRVSDSNEKHIDSEIEQHLKKPGKSILLSLGSSGTKKLFLDILCALNQTDYKVIAIYTKILNEDELPEVNDNILLKKFVPSIKKVHEMTDLAIIHGGRGTVYTAAYAGKPVIGIPMHSEQQNNLDNMVRHGTGIRLSKKYFSGKNLLQAIKDIFDNYDKYLENSQLLKSELPKPQGAENAAKRILEIVKEINT
jgi:UDP:flavonoid glycosyltransferase YjiC (YdhE family)